ncbi:GPR1/FUN34/YaaH family transporter [Streptomyces sp. NBC_00564]|uniref:GPR1/FUN34/YaaH family transporter n=1 Tax=Streptomyces sp. NBC_00564 TaxID=2903663 RepID=UPI002FCDC87A|nr:GPR1/FUN34/YaaH family transporter [Streptomyces sp. NBC_00564]
MSTLPSAPDGVPPNQPLHGPNGPQTRVMLRPIATSLPLGYLAFALGMIIMAADSLGWVDDEQVLVGVLLASYVFPLQLVATVMAFLGRDTVGATTLGLFTTSWLAFGLLDIVSRPGSTPTVLGLFSISFGVVVAGLAVAASRAKPLFTVVLAICSLRAVLAGLHVLTGSSGLQRAAGYVALVATAAAAYLGFALLIESAWPRAVLPLLRRGEAVSAMNGKLSAVRPGLPGEPGVREQL